MARDGFPLVDQFGNPLRSTDISGDRAGPNVIGIRPAVGSQFGAYFRTSPAVLADLLLAADGGNSFAWQELAAEIERRDLHYLGVLGTRKRSVAQLPIAVDAASDDLAHQAHASFVSDWLKTGILQGALFDMLDAIGKGWSVMEITWELRPDRIRPAALTFRPQRWFEVSWQDGESILLRSNITSRQLYTQPMTTPGFEQLPRAKFVVHRHPAFSGLTIGSGLARVVAWAWMFKSFAQSDWAQFVTNYGSPVRLGRYGRDASEQDRDVLWQAVSNIAGDCAAIIPQSMQMEFISPPSLAAAGELHQRRCDWLDSQVSKAVLGQTATTDASPGSHAAGRTHRLVQEDIERADCRQLETTVGQQLIEPMIAFTFGVQDAYPRLRIGRTDDTPIADITGALQWLGPQGLRVKATEVRQQLGFSEPAEGDEIVGGRLPTPSVTAPSDLPSRVIPAEDRPGTDRAPDPREEMILHAQIGRLLSKHVREEGPHVIDLMTARLARDAGDAMRSMTDRVRGEVDQATSLDDLKTRLDRLKLDPKEFAEAMQSAMAVAELAGQAGLLEEIGAV